MEQRAEHQADRFGNGHRDRTGHVSCDGAFQSAASNSHAGDFQSDHDRHDEHRHRECDVAQCVQNGIDLVRLRCTRMSELKYQPDRNRVQERESPNSPHSIGH